MSRQEEVLSTEGFERCPGLPTYSVCVGCGAMVAPHPQNQYIDAHTRICEGWAFVVHGPDACSFGEDERDAQKDESWGEEGPPF